MKTIGVKADVILTRTLYFDAEDDATEEQIRDKAKHEIMLPTNALQRAAMTFKQMHINATGMDMQDWEVLGVQYTPIDQVEVQPEEK